MNTSRHGMRALDVACCPEKTADGWRPHFQDLTESYRSVDATED